MKLLLGTIFLNLSWGVFACDVCNTFFEIIPNERKSSFGIYYSTIYRKGEPVMHTKHGGHLNWVGSELKEIFDTYDIRYRHAFSERFFGEVLLPIRNIYFGAESTQIFDRYGLGDMQFHGTYRIILPDVKKPINHRLDLTLGVDLPTGSWTDSINQIKIDPIYQFGSGSFDFWLSSSYVFRANNIGFSLSASYRRNTYNPLAYKFGDATLADVTLFYLLDFKKVKLFPRIGGFYEQGFAFLNRGTEDLHSGEKMTSLQYGFSLFYKQYQLNAIMRSVLLQKTRGMETRQWYSAQVALIYNFQK
jgi:hypothetical protein